MVDAIIQQSMLRKARTEGIIDFDVVDLRDFGQGNYRQIDDTPYGGGGGMVLMAEPLFAAMDHTIDKIGAGDAMLALLSASLRSGCDEKISLLVGSLAAAQSVETIGNSKSVSKNTVLKTLQHILK